MGAKTRTEETLTVLTTGGTSAIEASFIAFDLHCSSAYMDKSMIADCICLCPHGDAYRHIADQHPQEGAAVARISQSDQRGSHGAKQ